MSSKEKLYREVADGIKNCRRCSGLNIPQITESAPGFGSLYSPVFLVGQSLCRGCMKSQVPFTGGCGVLLDQALAAAKVRKDQIFISNVVHCHPPNNRPSLPREISNCRSHLQTELQIVSPHAIIALGRDAIEWFLGSVGQMQTIISRPQHNGNHKVYPFYHPSYIMKQTLSVRKEYVRSLADIIAIEMSNSNSAHLKPRLPITSFSLPLFDAGGI